MDNLAEILKKLYEVQMGSFIRHSNSLVIDGSTWAVKVTGFVTELKSHLTSLIEACKENMLRKMENHARKTHELNMKSQLNTGMEVLNETIVQDLKKTYVSNVTDFNDNIRPVLGQGFGMTEDDTYDFLKENEESIFEFAVSEMKNASRHVNVTLLRKFNEQFKKDDKGKSRNWRDIEENEITEIFKATKASIEVVLEEFKKI